MDMMITPPKRIVIEANKTPHLDGAWTVGELQQAIEFLSRWLAAQPVRVAAPPTVEDETQS
jgi:hypothetical protein